MKGTLEITTTVHCVNVCTYCPQELLKNRYVHESKKMTFDVFKVCLDKVPKDITIDFSGYAEPFLNQNTTRMIKYASDQGYTIRLFTTLVGLKMEHVDSLRECKLSSVILHLPDEDAYLKCDVDDNYCAVAAYFKSHIWIHGSHVYGRLHHRLTALFPGVETKRVTNEHLHTRANNVQSEKITLQNHEYVAGDIGCDVIRRKGGTELNHNVLLPNGDVYICCMDYGLEHKIGNLLTDNYEDLHKSEGYNYLINGMKKDANYDILCRTCKEAYIK